jgi:hypothetical protein
LVTIYEAEDFASQGAVVDRFLADPEGMAIMTAINTTAGPTAGFQSSLWIDVPV